MVEINVMRVGGMKGFICNQNIKKKKKLVISFTLKPFALCIPATISVTNTVISRITQRSVFNNTLHIMTGKGLGGLGVFAHLVGWQVS